MYWQVYLHKTVLAAEWMMMGILDRARTSPWEEDVLDHPVLRPFLYDDLDRARFMADPEVIAAFCALDDNDVMCCIKAWQDHPDTVLSELCRRLTHRRLFKIELRDAPFDQGDIAERIEAAGRHFGLDTDDAACFVLHDRIDNRAYSTASHGIQMLYKGRFGPRRGLSVGPPQPQCPERPGGAAFLAYPKELPPRPGAGITG